MPCNYFAPNGEPSILFNSLSEHYSKFYNTAEAERMAAAAWLYTRTDSFKQKFGDWTKDNSEEPSLLFKELNNQIIPYFSGLNGAVIASENFAPTSVSDTSDGIQTVTLSVAGTEDEISKKIANMQSRGLEIKTIKNTDGKSFVTGTTEKDNIYFNDDVLSLENAVPVSEFISDQDSASRILKSIIREPIDESNQAIATQIAVSFNRQPRISLLTRAEINEAYPDYKDKPVINMFYNAARHEIVINSDIEINAAEFENIMLEEIIHANTANAINSNDAIAGQWARQYESTKKAMKDAKMSSKYMENSTEFLYGVLRDSKFRQEMKNMKIPGTQNSIFDSVFNWIMELFGFRRSQYSNVESMLDIANQVMKRSLATVNASYMAEIIQDANKEENTDVPDVDKLVAEKEGATASNTYVDLNEPAPVDFAKSKLYDKYLNALMEKVLSIRKSKQQRTISTNEKRKQNSQGTIYRKDLKDLQQSLTYATLIRIGSSEVQLMENHLDDATSLSQINESLKLLKAWSDLSVGIANDLKENNEEFDQELNEFVNDISSKAILLYAQYKGKLYDVFTKSLEEERVPPSIINGIHVNMTIDDIGSLASNFIGLSYGQNSIEHLVDFLIRKAAYETNQEKETFESEYQRRLDIVGGNIDFAFVKDKNGKSVLARRYSEKLYDQMQEMRSKLYGYEDERKPMEEELKQLTADFKDAKRKGNVDLAESLSNNMSDIKDLIAQHKKDTLAWDDYHEFMRQHFDFNTELDEDQLQEWEQYKNDLRSVFADRLEGDEETINEAWYQAELSKSDPERFIEWVKTGKNRPADAARFFKASPKAEWENNEYFNKLTPAQKDFYDWFVEEFVKAHENMPQEELNFGQYEMDKVIGNFAFFDDQGLSKMKYLAKEITEGFKDWVSVKYDESAESFKLKAPLSGRPVDSVSFKPIDKLINRSAGYLKKENITPEIQKKIDKGSYKINEDGLVVYAKNDKPIKHTEQIRVDPIKVFRDFKNLSLSYKYKKEMEDYLNTAKEMTYDAEIIQKTPDGKIKTKFGQMFTAKGSNNVQDRLDYTVDNFLYGNSKDPITKNGGKPGERQFSIEQTIDSINQFTRVRQLGLNFASGITNLAMGTIGNWQYAARDDFFDEKELGKAYWKLKSSIGSLATGGKMDVGESKKILLFSKKFGIFGNFREDALKDAGAMGKLFNHMFVFQEGGEYMNQGAVMIAMMMREKLKNKDGSEYLVGGKAVSVWDAYEVKDGAVTLKYKDTNYEDPEKLRIFGNAIQKVNKEIHGDYDPLNAMKIKRSIAGRLLMTFKTWLPMAIKSRTGVRYRDEQLSQHVGTDIWREGRWKTFARYGFSKGIAKNSTNLLRFAAATAASTIGIIPGMDKALVKGILKGMDISEEDMANMMVNVKEAWWLMTISVLGVVLKGMATGDDDDDKSVEGLKSLKKRRGAKQAAVPGIYKWLYNQSQRLDNDLWFYYNPSSYSKVIKEPIAISGTLKDMLAVTSTAWQLLYHPDHDTYTRGFRKGNSKFWTATRMFLPVTKQGESLFSMFSQVYTNQYAK